MSSGQASNRDFQLAMAISPRSKREDELPPMRSLLVHRLVDGPKAVWRRSFSDEDKTSAYCEACRTWIRKVPLTEEFTHEACGRVYRVEFAVLEEVMDDDGEAP